VTLRTGRPASKGSSSRSSVSVDRHEGWRPVQESGSVSDNTRVDTDTAFGRPDHCEQKNLIPPQNKLDTRALETLGKEGSDRSTIAHDLRHGKCWSRELGARKGLRQALNEMHDGCAKGTTTKESRKAVSEDFERHRDRVERPPPVPCDAMFMCSGYARQADTLRLCGFFAKWGASQNGMRGEELVRLDRSSRRKG
jgi:hypothetical protein